MNKKVAVLCDFDGTVSERDIGHHFFGEYITGKDRWEELLERWKMGLISSKECLEKELEWIEAVKGDLDSFIEGEKLDPYFKDFVDFCNRRKFEIMILSDGLDYYIDKLLMKFGLGFIEFKANHLVLTNGNLSSIEFPYYNVLECTRCGNCKRCHLESLKEKDRHVIYVGNGYSDCCPAEHSGLVFAKGDLLDHCRRENIEFIPYQNFRDVEREITNRLFLSK